MNWAGAETGLVTRPLESGAERRTHPYVLAVTVRIWKKFERRYDVETSAMACK